jgi:hypothetical protein
MSETLEAPVADAATGGDDLDSVLGAAYDAAVAEAPEEAPQRDERGRFASPATQDTAEQVGKTDQPEQPATEQAQPAIEPPASWSDAEKAAWSDLKPEVQQAIARREKDTDTVLRERAETEKAFQPIKEVLAPYQQKHAMAGLNDAEAVRRVLAAQDMLERDFDGALPALIKAFGRDPLQVAQAMLGSQVQQGATQNQAVVYDPRVDRLEAELQAREQRDLLSRIDAFAKDPANPHFEAVRQDMGLLIQANPELSLKQAYEKAVWSNDATRQKLIADEKAKADADRTKAAAEAKAKRDRAASSVRNAPTSAGSARRATNNNSIEDDLNAAIEAVGWA